MNFRKSAWHSWPMVLLVAASLAVTACGGKRKHRRECGKVQAYERARAAPSLYVPEDLSRPEAETTRRIPALGADGQTGICMSRPPQTLSEETMEKVRQKDDIRSIVKAAKAEEKARRKAEKAERKAAKERRRSGEPETPVEGQSGAGDSDN